MELKVEAKNLEMRDNWQEKIEEEKAKLIRHYANLVLLSSPSSRDIYYKGYDTIPSQTVCYPAKLSHGHVLDLIERGVRCPVPAPNPTPLTAGYAYTNHRPIRYATTDRKSVV